MKKWSKWEYWPAYMFYIPILPYWFFLAIKARHPVFFAAANPGMKAGGSGFESKYQTIMLIPEKWRPESLYIPRTNNIEKVLELISGTNLTYPFIVKPDIGFRGLLVAKIRNENELLEYISTNELDLIIQEFIEGNVEYGVFYHRVPSESKGKVSSLTQKVYLQVVGDAVSSVMKLMEDGGIDDRFVKMVEVNNDFGFLGQIIEHGERLILSHIGNHSKGAKFINAQHLISEELEKQIDLINKEIKGWYYGRLDLKVNSIEDLKEGVGIKILEINGVFGEPAHIYDSSVMTYSKALKEIVKHWNYIYRVSIASRKKGADYFNTFEMLREIVKLIKYKLKLERITKKGMHK